MLASDVSIDLGSSGLGQQTRKERNVLNAKQDVQWLLKVHKLLQPCFTNLVTVTL